MANEFTGPGRAASWLARRGATLATVLDQGIVSGTSFLTGAIVGRLGSRQELGLYALGLTLLLLLLSAQSSLVSVPLMVHGSRLAPSERPAFAGSTLVHQLALAATALLLLGGLGPVLARCLGTPEAASVAPVLALVAPFAMAREYVRQLLFARLRFRSALVLDTIVAVVQLGLLLLMARRGGISARSAYQAIGLACAAAVAVYVVALRDSFEIRRDRIGPDLAASWVIGKWAFASNALGLAGSQLYPWVLATMRGTEEAGVLAACMGITYLANPVIMGLSNHLGPRAMHAFSTNGLDAARRTLRSATATLAIVMGVVTPMLFLAGGALLVAVYGPRYQGYGLVVGVLSLAQAIDVLGFPLNYGFFILGRADVIVRGNLIALLVASTLGLAAVHRLGPLGVALALLTGNAMSAVYRWRALTRLDYSPVARSAAPDAAPDDPVLNGGS
jgi:O-antigen/teichoic acid export membrane protein